MSTAQVYLPWFWFDKCPPLVIPELYKMDWSGFYLPSTSNNDYPDLTTSNGNFTICDDFDFDNPKTDYDRACALDKTGLLKVQEEGWALVIDTVYVIAYWEAKQTFIVKNNTFSTLQEIASNTLILKELEDNWSVMQWQTLLTMDVSTENMCLMNSCEHGANPEIPPHELLCFQLEPGHYRLQYTDCAALHLELFHFEKT